MNTNIWEEQAPKNAWNGLDEKVKTPKGL